MSIKSRFGLGLSGGVSGFPLRLCYLAKYMFDISIKMESVIVCFEGMLGFSNDVTFWNGESFVENKV